MKTKKKSAPRKTPRKTAIKIRLTEKHPQVTVNGVKVGDRVRCFYCNTQFLVPGTAVAIFESGRCTRVVVAHDEHVRHFHKGVWDHPTSIFVADAQTSSPYSVWGEYYVYTINETPRGRENLEDLIVNAH